MGSQRVRHDWAHTYIPTVHATSTERTFTRGCIFPCLLWDLAPSVSSLLPKGQSPLPCSPGSCAHLELFILKENFHLRLWLLLSLYSFLILSSPMSGLPFLSNSSFNHLQSDLVSPLKTVPLQAQWLPKQQIWWPSLSTFLFEILSCSETLLMVPFSTQILPSPTFSPPNSLDILSVCPSQAGLSPQVFTLTRDAAGDVKSVMFWFIFW